jgi:hypothetical protein
MAFRVLSQNSQMLNMYADILNQISSELEHRLGSNTETQ